MRTRSQMWQRIKEARRRAGITQQQLAKRIGVSAAAVGQWEGRTADKRTMPSRESVRGIAKVTGAPLDWLLSDESDISGPWSSEKSEKPTLGERMDAVVELESGQPLVLKKVPVLRLENVKRWLDLGGGRMDGGLASDEVQLLCPIPASDKTFVLQVKGIQNEPAIRDGEFAYIDPEKDWESGNFVLVEYGVSELPRLRQVMSEDRQSGIVRCANPSWPEPPVALSDVRILGVVIFAGRFVI